MTAWSRARRSRPAAAIACAVGAIALMIGVLSGGAAAAQVRAGAPLRDAVVQDATAVSVTITAVTPQILKPGDDLTITATASNTSTQTIEQPRAAVLLSRTDDAAAGITQGVLHGFPVHAGHRLRQARPELAGGVEYAAWHPSSRRACG